MRIRWGLVVFFVLLAGCGDGGGADEAAVEAVDPVDLGMAFEQTASADGYRIRQSNAQTMSSTALGVDTKTEVDLDSPDIVVEVRGARSHMVMDLTKLFEPMAGGATDGVTMEMWTDPDRVVIDSRNYQRLLDQNPGAELGPFAPGISFVDLRALEADDPELVSAIVGGGFADPALLAERLPQALGELEEVGERTYTGTAPYTEVMRAFGADPEQTARSIAAGLALNMGVDVEALTRFYVDFYEKTPSEVTVGLTPDGAVERISTKVDLSGIYTAIFSAGEELGIPMTAEEARQGPEMFADTVWKLEVVAEFESVPDLVVPDAPATDDDRTAQWVEFMSPR